MIQREPLIVVEGRISPDTAGSEVWVRQSTGLAGVDTARAVRGAEVRFESQAGQTHRLRETQPGQYRSDPAVFMPGVGESYRLVIITPDNRRITSSYEKLKPAPPISSLEATFAVQEPDNPDAPLEYGLQFTLDTNDPGGQTLFYRWEWEETYEFFLSYPIFERWRFEPIPGAYPLQDQEKTRHCWRFGQSQEVILATSRRLTEDRIVAQPIHFLSATSGKINWTYSLLVKQFALSEAEFTFWSSLRENTETTGSLFDPIPSELRGNLQEEDAPDRPVIGFFGASAISTKRIFVSRETLSDNTRITRPYQSCFPDTLPLSVDSLAASLAGGNLWLDTAYSENPTAPPLTPVGFITIPAPCGDCNLTGSSQKPSYWPQ